MLVRPWRPVAAAVVFLSAFLLFQVQPILGRVVLPWFGGSAAVWTICLLFFQLGLLLGYLYAHGLARRFSPSRQAWIHGALLAISLASLPILPGPGWKPEAAEHPTWHLLLLLAAAAGLPFLLLASTSPLVQWWVSRQRESATYRLYAVSNAGSMLALVSYPVLVEPVFSVSTQSWIWSACYVLFVLGAGGMAISSARSGLTPAPTHRRKKVDPRPGPSKMLYVTWLAFAACGSTLLISVTSHLSLDVAPVPFLWILPLSLYLLSFILCFGARSWYRRYLFLALLVPSLAAMTYLTAAGLPGIVTTITVFSASLFVGLMVCHGELSASKPHPRHLTSFYLMVALGGATGGVFTGVVAPVIFDSYYELRVGFAMCGVLAVLVATSRARAAAAGTWSSLKVTMIVAVATCFLIYLVNTVRNSDADEQVRTTARNFYGSVAVRDLSDATGAGDYRMLYHGSTFHGGQWLDPERRTIPTGYYCRDAGIGAAIQAIPEGSRRVGVIGLGAGTLAAYGRDGDYYRFYEINPLIVRLANEQFTYLRDSPAEINVVLGDARLSLEREPPQRFDVLAVDAFSGDSIPVHLLTREAMDLYFRHLAPTGTLAVHISNRFLDLSPVPAAYAGETGKLAVSVETDTDYPAGCSDSKWILLGNRTETNFDRDFLALGSSLPPRTGFRMWTDNFSNLLGVLR